MWNRPESVPFPSIWKRFEGRRKIDGIVPRFWIQDIPEDEYENVVDCMINRFSGDEPLTKYSDFLKDEESVQDFRAMWNEILKDKLGIICYMENPDFNGKPIFAGLNCTYKKVKSENEKERFKLHGKAAVKILSTMAYLEAQKDAFVEVNTDVLLSALGLYVVPELRGQNIGLQLLYARSKLCRAVGIRAAVTVFTATSSQIIAERAGYRVLYQISYEDLAKKKPEFNYPGIQSHTKVIKYCYKEFT